MNKVYKVIYLDCGGTAFDKVNNGSGVVEYPDDVTISDVTKFELIKIRDEILKLEAADTDTVLSEEDKVFALEFYSSYGLFDDQLCGWFECGEDSYAMVISAESEWFNKVEYCKEWDDETNQRWIEGQQCTDEPSNI